MQGTFSKVIDRPAGGSVLGRPQGKHRVQLGAALCGWLEGRSEWNENQTGPRSPIALSIKDEPG
jgi:hypothetical protein